MNCLLFLCPPFLAQEAQATPSPGVTQETVFEAAAGRRLGDDPPGSCLGPHPRSDSRMYD